MATDKDRHQAVQRALKMNILFKTGTFDDIMTALNKPENDPTRETDFYAALPASLVQAEKDWLWNYLKHCTETGTGGWGIKPVGGAKWVPDVTASVGW